MSQSDELVVCFDVSSPFTGVPTHEAVELMHDMLKEDEPLKGRTAVYPTDLLNC